MPAGDGHVQWWFDVPADTAEQIAPQDRVDYLWRRFGHWAAPVPEVVAQVDGAQIEPWPYTWHPVPKQLAVARAVLIGDAAHAMPPTMAQGASQTLDDAWVLVDAIASHADVDTALRDYQRRRRWRAAAMVRVCRSQLALRGPSAAMSRWSSRTPPGLAAGGFANWLRLMSDSLG
jgi:FAD-dependent urate hydroxylase